MDRPHDDVGALWRRVFALVLDWSAMWALFFMMQVTGLSFWVRAHSDAVTPAPWGSWFLAYVTVAAMVTVLSIVYVGLTGQTPGMDMLGLRVESLDGAGDGSRAVPIRRAVVRAVLPGLVIALPVAYAVAGLVAIGAPALIDARRRTIADRLSGTCVVSTGVVDAPRAPVNVNVIKFAMEKWLGGVSGDHGLLKLNDVHEPDARKLSE